MCGIGAADANARKTVAKICDERRIALDQKEALRINALPEKRTGDGSGPCAELENV